MHRSQPQQAAEKVPLVFITLEGAESDMRRSIGIFS